MYSLCVWLLSLSLMISRFICVAACIRTSFFMAEKHSIVWMYYILFIHPVYGHLGCFQLLAIMTNAAMNIMCRCLHGHVFCLLGMDPGVELLRHVATRCLTFWENARLFLKRLCHFMFLPTGYEDPLFFTSLPILNTVILIIVTLMGVKSYLIVGFFLCIKIYTTCYLSL